MHEKQKSHLLGTSQEAEEQHLAETLKIIQNNLEKYGTAVSSLRQSIDDMQAHFHDDNPELINELENTYTMYQFLDKTLEQHKRAAQKPYFGRIDFFDEALHRQESFYIGRCSISKDVIHPVVIDWRSPAANTYYENGLGPCCYFAPDETEIKIDLQLKRTYEIENGQLQNIFDTEVIANDDILTKYLSKNKQAVLGEIVATIQKEQNEIIRKTPYHNTIVQGAAGSGKTTVAMHRISYILYNYKDRFRPEDFYIVGSNQILLNYITGVLPDLDVYGVRQLTMEQLFVRLLYEDWDENKFQIVSTSPTPNNIAKGQLSWFRDLERFCMELEQKMISTDSIYLDPKQFVEGIVDGKTGVHDRRNGKPADPKNLVLLMDGAAVERYLQQNPALSIQSKINMLNERLKIRIHDEFLGKGVKYTEAERKAISKELNGKYGSRSWKKSIFTLYAEFLQQQTSKGLNVDIPDTNFDVYDLAALAYLYKRVKETEIISEAHHMVIDEAQDFGMMVYSVLKFCVKDCTYTIMGDVSQNIHFGYGLNDWEELKELYLTNSRASFCVLRKSYRNTIEISDFATNILRHGTFAVYPVEPIIRHGTAPVVRQCPNRQTLLAQAAEICRHWQQNGLETIAVICRDTAAAKQTEQELSPLINLMESALETAKFGTGIMVLPVEYTKGLEFDAVLILNPTQTEYPVDNGHAKLLYVAATRALHELCVLYTDSLTGLIADPIPAHTLSLIEAEDNISVSASATKTDPGKTQVSSAAKTVSGMAQTSSAAKMVSGMAQTFSAAKTVSGMAQTSSAAKMVSGMAQTSSAAKTVSGMAQTSSAVKTDPGKTQTSAAAWIKRKMELKEKQKLNTPVQTASAEETLFGTPPANELLRPAGHALTNLAVRWVTQQSDGLCLHSSAGILRICPVSGNIIRVTFTKGNQMWEGTHPGIVQREAFRKWKYRDSGKLLEIKTEQLYLRIDKTSGAITFMSDPKTLLLEECSRESHLIEIPAHGRPRTRLYLNWAKTEKLYALGAGTKAELSLKGTARYISHKKSLQKLPLILSEKGYGILPAADGPVFCCSIPTYGMHLCAEHAQILDYYFIKGDTAQNIIGLYNELCGRC